MRQRKHETWTQILQCKLTIFEDSGIMVIFDTLTPKWERVFFSVYERCNSSTVQDLLHNWMKNWLWIYVLSNV